MGGDLGDVVRYGCPILIRNSADLKKAGAPLRGGIRPETMGNPKKKLWIDPAGQKQHTLNPDLVTP